MQGSTYSQPRHQDEVGWLVLRSAAFTPREIPRYSLYRRLSEPQGQSGHEGEKIQLVHTMCIRYIFNIRKYDHVSPSFQELSWLRHCDQRKIHFLILLFKILHTLTPSCLASRFHFLSGNHYLNTRLHHNLLLNIPQHKTSHYSTSYTVSTALYWNSLPQEIRGCWTLESFKWNLNLFFL